MNGSFNRNDVSNFDNLTERSTSTGSSVKKKSAYYPFRDIEKFTSTYHACLRMNQRQVSLEDVKFILRHGRALLMEKDGQNRISLFLCPGEIPKGKAEQKTFGRLWGHVVIVERDKPMVLTVIKNWFKWRRRIYGEPASCLQQSQDRPADVWELRH